MVKPLIRGHCVHPVSVNLLLGAIAGRDKVAGGKGGFVEADASRSGFWS